MPRNFARVTWIWAPVSTPKPSSERAGTKRFSGSWRTGTPTSAPIFLSGCCSRRTRRSKTGLGMYAITSTHRMAFCFWMSSNFGNPWPAETVRAAQRGDVQGYVDGEAPREQVGCAPVPAGAGTGRHRTGGHRGQGGPGADQDPEPRWGGPEVRHQGQWPDQLGRGEGGDGRQLRGHALLAACTAMRARGSGDWPNDAWTAAIYAADRDAPLGAGVVIDDRRGLTCLLLIESAHLPGALLLVRFPTARVPRPAACRVARGR